MNTVNKTEALDVVLAELERSLSVLEQKCKKVVSNLSELRQCVDTDDLTRLLRRGAFMKKLHTLLQESESHGKEVQLLMIDVDHFKKVNDTHGHQSGDVVLERVSELIKSYLRPDDLAGRYGGEEIIVAIQASSQTAQAVAENIRKAVERTQIASVASGSVFNVTLSMGIASTHEFLFEADSLIRGADAALYRAKNNGRNRVVNAADGSVIGVDFNLETAVAA